VANVPIVKDIPLPAELLRISPRRVIGLGIEYKRLIEFRRRREEQLGWVGNTSYSRPSAVLAELEAARRIYKEGGFNVVEVTDKPIEIIAAEIVNVVSPNLDKDRRRPMPY
jgi:regulator of PEP synthase PpsR (kinase-PPPase family)